MSWPLGSPSFQPLDLGKEKLQLWKYTDGRYMNKRHAEYIYIYNYTYKFALYVQELVAGFSLLTTPGGRQSFPTQVLIVSYWLSMLLTSSKKRGCFDGCVRFGRWSLFGRDWSSFVEIYRLHQRVFICICKVYTYSLKKPSHIVCTFINIDIGINMNTNIYIYIYTYKFIKVYDIFILACYNNLVKG